MKRLSKALHIAPLMRYSDEHFRVLLHAIAPNAITYTEMATFNEILHRSRKAHRVAPEEGPVILQLGGADPDQLAKCVAKAQDWGYAGVDLNVGCPSLKVMAMEAGVCLLRKPHLVHDCVQAMMEATDLPVSVKTRIGIDDEESYAFIHGFIDTVQKSGLKTFTLHARKAWTQGVSPKQNRNVPPLNYERVFALKRAFPDLTFHLNGGLTSWEMIEPLIGHVDGVMLGRMAIDDPWAIRIVDKGLFGDSQRLSKAEVLEEYLGYCQRKTQEGVSLRLLLRHLFGLVSGSKGAKAWRRSIQEQIQSNHLSMDVLVSQLLD